MSAHCKENMLMNCSMKIAAIFILLPAISHASQIETVTTDVWAGKARIRSGNAQVNFQADPLKLEVAQDGIVRFSTADESPFAFEATTGTKRSTTASVIHRRFQGFVADLVNGSMDTGRLVVTMDPGQHIRIRYLPPSGDVNAVFVNLTQSEDAHFYGLGDLWSTETVDARGYKVRMWDHTGTPDECAYVPFYMSTTGYGLFVDDAYPGTFDFGKTDREMTTLRFESPSLSMHLWVGENMQAILPQYLDMTGYPPLPPDWTFLPQVWRDAGNWDVVFADVKRMEDNGIPLGAVWLDRPWMQGRYGSDDFIFDEKRYPNAAERIQDLHDRGVRVIVWGCDFLTQDSRYLQEALEKNYIAATDSSDDPNGVHQFIVDFAQPDAREWFKDKIENVLRMGVDGIKLDRGQTYPTDATPPSGRDPMEMHNYHAYLMVKTYAEALREVRGTDFQFTPRAGWTGTQAWTMKWPGDLSSDFETYSGLPSAVRVQTAAGMTGFAFWGSDIGGYDSELSKEVFIRWLEFGVFSPLMETPGKGNHEKGPFSWDDNTVQVYKYYALLRKNLIPYLKAMAAKSHQTGTPMVRHLAWEWQDDPNVHELHYEYMFGDDLLIAPVVDDKMSRTVYLPEGTWVDFWNRKRTVEGPTSLNEKVPLNKIPVFIRQGSQYNFDLPKMTLPE